MSLYYKQTENKVEPLIPFYPCYLWCADEVGGDIWRDEGPADTSPLGTLLQQTSLGGGLIESLSGERGERQIEFTNKGWANIP